MKIVAAKNEAEKPSVIQLSKVYALSNILTLEDCFASDSTFRKWPYLKDLCLPIVDKSGVSIYQDFPEAL